tara:strand:- start:1793 stop:1987 length:195 start_codon:yes stop_codon:yes gene_type:complete
MTKPHDIEVELTVKATGELQNEIEEELKVADPDKAKAINILSEEEEDSEDTEGNDRTGSDGNDN